VPLLFAGLLLSTDSGFAAQGEETEIFSRSLVSVGDTIRLQQALAKTRRVETVTIAVIGGSITQGASASLPEKRYGDLVAAWWRRSFPKAKVEFVNAGLGATGSDYGALRVKRDSLSRHPDFVVVEYGVNDPDSDAAAETLEGLVRQILNNSESVAVLLLFTMNQSGGNAQKAHGKVGRHYGLPMVSFRDALWSEIEQSRMKWSDVEADAVHPNDRVHEYCARFIIQLLEKVMGEVADATTLTQMKPLPAPLYSDLFEHVSLLEADALKPVVNDGWSCDATQPTEKCWKADKPGSSVEFVVEGKVVLIMDWHLRGPMGQATVQVDDMAAVVREAWFDQTWGGYHMTTVLARDLKLGKHRVKIRLLSESNPKAPVMNSGYWAWERRECKRAGRISHLERPDPL
jgi:lysophospholipase L1-like esterase